MCTAITLQCDHFYFGRNLDWENDCSGRIVVCPRNYPFRFRDGTFIDHHYAFIGVAAICEGYPLYFDAVNECGIGMAGLNFPHYACYQEYAPQKKNLAPFELIPWLLGSCSNIDEVKSVLQNVCVWNVPFSETLPLSPLHWLIADKNSCVTVEVTQEGLHVYDNPYGVLSNSPPFPYHRTHLAHYINLTSMPPVNRFSPELRLEPFSFGMGAIGLPGDLSSSSRFIKATFTKWNTPTLQNEKEALAHFFHLLSSVEQPKGVTQFPQGGFEYTVYSSCCNATQGIYYYTTYDSHRIRGVDMHSCDLEATQLFEYPLLHSTQIDMQSERNAP